MKRSININKVTKEIKAKIRFNNIDKIRSPELFEMYSAINLGLQEALKIMESHIKIYKEK